MKSIFFWTAQTIILSYPFIFASHSSPSWPLCSIINPSALPLSVLKLMKTKTCFKICSLLTQNQVSISLSADFDVFKKKLGWKKELKVLENREVVDSFFTFFYCDECLVNFFCLFLTNYYKIFTNVWKKACTLESNSSLNPSNVLDFNWCGQLVVNRRVDQISCDIGFDRSPSGRVTKKCHTCSVPTPNVSLFHISCLSFYSLALFSSLCLSFYSLTLFSSLSTFPHLPSAAHCTRHLSFLPVWSCDHHS